MACCSGNLSGAAQSLTGRLQPAPERGGGVYRRTRREPASVLRGGLAGLAGEGDEGDLADAAGYPAGGLPVFGGSSWRLTGG